MGSFQKVVLVVATPSSPLLPHLLHALSHRPELKATLLTRETSITLSSIQARHHHHDGGAHDEISHLTTDYSPESLKLIFNKLCPHTIICHLTGSDIHNTPALITAATASGVKHFIPSEYGLATRNAEIRGLLPPYRLRHDIQQLLRKNGIHWTAIYAGLTLEDGMKLDGVLGIDCEWGSATLFPETKAKPVIISTYKDIAKFIVKVVEGEKTDSNEIWVCSLKVTLDELISAVESKLNQKFDIYEADIEKATQEAASRLEGGYFDGGVALMGKVAVWDPRIDVWRGWQDVTGASQDGWKDLIGSAASDVKAGQLSSGGCGC